MLPAEPWLLPLLWEEKGSGRRMRMRRSHELGQAGTNSLDLAEPGSPITDDLKLDLKDFVTL